MELCKLIFCNLVQYSTVSKINVLTESVSGMLNLNLFSRIVLLDKDYVKEVSFLRTSWSVSSTNWFSLLLRTMWQRASLQLCSELIFVTHYSSVKLFCLLRHLELSTLLKDITTQSWPRNWRSSFIFRSNGILSKPLCCGLILWSDMLQTIMCCCFF